MSLHAIRTGQATSDTAVMTTVMKNTKKDEDSTKPAPGPMYASARDGQASKAHTAIAPAIATGPGCRRDSSRVRSLVGLEIDVLSMAASIDGAIASEDRACGAATGGTREPPAASPTRR